MYSHFISTVISIRFIGALVKHYKENGMTPQIHGNKGRAPSHSLAPDDCQAVISFIVNYAEVNAILLPGRIPGYKQDDLKLLPS